jgi:hypothetical protein
LSKRRTDIGAVAIGVGTAEIAAGIVEIVVGTADTTVVGIAATGVTEGSAGSIVTVGAIVGGGATGFGFACGRSVSRRPIFGEDLSASRPILETAADLSKWLGKGSTVTLDSAVDRISNCGGDRRYSRGGVYICECGALPFVRRCNRRGNREVVVTEYERFRLTELVWQYVRSRSKLGCISVAAASKAVATVMPDCPVGAELEELIEEIALKDGHSLLLDAHQ